MVVPDCGSSLEAISKKHDSWSFRPADASDRIVGFAWQVNEIYAMTISFEELNPNILWWAQSCGWIEYGCLDGKVHVEYVNGEDTTTAS
jgi:hypothetical protein